jgi:hypothetical protein
MGMAAESGIQVAVDQVIIELQHGLRVMGMEISISF